LGAFELEAGRFGGDAAAPESGVSIVVESPRIQLDFDDTGGGGGGLDHGVQRRAAEAGAAFGAGHCDLLDFTPASRRAPRTALAALRGPGESLLLRLPRGIFAAAE
jgi:hypothetical protein